MLMETQRNTSLMEEQVEAELYRIADWWCIHAFDGEKGGFYGEVAEDNCADKDAERGVVMHSRILWFFSSVAHQSGSDRYRKMADHAYAYLFEKFDDKEHGGVYWSVDCNGIPVETKKQTYAIAFAIYGLCAYYRLTKIKNALELARSYFSLIQEHCYDKTDGGYLEAFSRTWHPLSDVRLSEKDDNLPKTQNTHLHVMEAFTALHDTDPTAATEEALQNLIVLFRKYIISPDTHHLHLFMDMQWKDHSNTYSYGHDIECSWLLLEAIETLKNQEIHDEYLPLVIKMAYTTLSEGIGKHGQVCDECNIATGQRDQVSCWWVQAEAMVGFLYAFQLTDDKAFWDAFNQVWDFTQQQHIDKSLGEWHWFEKSSKERLTPSYKAGFWKGPYHNGRAMMEVLSLLKNLN